MKPSTVRLTAGASLAVGLSVLATPAAFADGFVVNNQVGNNSSQHASGLGNTVEQSAQDDVEAEINRMRMHTRHKIDSGSG